MNTKHENGVRRKPATPLPWFECAFSWVQPKKDEVNAPYENLLRDGRFALHAANAYPRLVEALRALVDAESVYGDATNVAINEAWGPADQLLRELGEL